MEKRLTRASLCVLAMLLAAWPFAAPAQDRRAASAKHGAGAQAKKGAESAKPAAAAAVAAKPAIVVREVDLASLKALLQRDPAKARPLIINFWATWCEPCREEFPDLVKIDEEYGARSDGAVGRVDFITVSLDDPEDIRKGVPEYLQKMNARMPAYLLNVPDPEQVINLVDPTWSGAMPATFLFDAQGHIVFKHMGRIKPDELREALKKVTSNE